MGYSIFRIFLSFVLFNTVVFAEPTKKETIEFIQSKLNVNRNIDHGGYRKYTERQRFIDNGNCNFTIQVVNDGMKEINTRYREIYGEHKEEYIFSAKDLDPTKVFYDEGNSLVSQVSIGALEYKKNIVLKQYYYEPVDKSKRHFCIKDKDKEYSLKFLSSNECVLSWSLNEVLTPLLLSPQKDNRPRVIKAMKHLIRICGGKSELF